MEARGAINQYRCNTCQWYANTMNLNAGVTPFTVGCPNRPQEPVTLGDALELKPGEVIDAWELIRQAQQDHMVASAMYRIESLPFPIKVITHVFYRPTPGDFHDLDEWSQDHVLSGGLLFAPIGTVTPIIDNIDDEVDFEDFQQFCLAVYKMRKDRG